MNKSVPAYKRDRAAVISRIFSMSLSDLKSEACGLRDQAHGEIVSYSRKVFIPLTKLCRDVCHYCTFAQTPKALLEPYLSIDQVMEIAESGRRAGCKEALFTLGDKPELRYAAARKFLNENGYDSTVDYLVAACRQVLDQTGLLPHVNAGIVTREEMARLKTVSASQGIMLESTSSRLLQKGLCHHGSPDKDPAVRLRMIEEAGQLKIPFTTGILIGIGENREERLEALFAIADLHDRFGHIQEVIVQNFRAKPGTKMADHAEPSKQELEWTVAAARVILGAEMNIQVPPNLTADGFGSLVQSGLNDWGGVSPITPDHVNPEAAWPQIKTLRSETEKQGKILVERLTSYPEYVKTELSVLSDQAIWHDPLIKKKLRLHVDADGFAREDTWTAGSAEAVPQSGKASTPATPAVSGFASLHATLRRAGLGKELETGEIAELFSVRGGAVAAITEFADELRKDRCGDKVTYVVNRNINYTNVCSFKCGFCAFSKGQKSDKLRGRAYDVPLEEIVRRSVEAKQRGATEICLQGGIHPDYSGDTYVEIVKAIKQELPDIHVHAFSPLEINEGARHAELDVAEYVELLREEGLGSLPGTAAEILHDDVRRVICPDKLDTNRWIDILRSAHTIGVPTTSTIMFGHVESPHHWASHLLQLRRLQAETGGITEFVPLPFVHTEAPIFMRGNARRGPTFREVLLMHAVARIVLFGLIDNIQVSWVKLGEQGVTRVLRAGANDLGGTLMNESISRAAGTVHGQEWSPSRMERVIRGAGRTPQQRTTLYVDVEPGAVDHSNEPLAEIVLPPAGKRAAIGSRKTKNRRAELAFAGNNRTA